MIEHFKITAAVCKSGDMEILTRRSGVLLTTQIVKNILLGMRENETVESKWGAGC